MSVKVELAKDLSMEDIRTVAKMWHREWWKAERYTLSETVEYVLHCHTDGIPALALCRDEDNRIIGTATLCMDDLPIRPDIFPWIANVLVREEYRGQRLSEKMINLLLERAKECGQKRLYLYTKHTGLYEKYGWKRKGDIDTLNYEPRWQNLYFKEI